MATDLRSIIDNLTAFYDFSGKRVLHIGAGGGQLIDYACHAQQVIAVDIDAAAIEKLQKNVVAKNLEHKISVRKQELAAIEDTFDVVFFEFCLHEFSDPDTALRHAATLAPEILIIDHSPDSKWAWTIDETELLQKSWQAIQRMNVRKKTIVNAEQFFSTGQELQSRLATCGEIVQMRITGLKEQSDITINMPYSLALIRQNLDF